MSLTPAAYYADSVVITDDNPCKERPAKILSDIICGINYDNFVVISRREHAVKYALRQAGADDIVLIAGKGHEEYRIIGRGQIYFSDEEVVQNFFAAIS